MSKEHFASFFTTFIQSQEGARAKVKVLTTQKIRSSNLTGKKLNLCAGTLRIFVPGVFNCVRSGVNNCKLIFSIWLLNFASDLLTSEFFVRFSHWQRAQRKLASIIKPGGVSWSISVLRDSQISESCWAGIRKIHRRMLLCFAILMVDVITSVLAWRNLLPAGREALAF